MYYIQEKHSVYIYIGLSTIHGFRHPLGVLERVFVHKGGLLYLRFRYISLNLISNKTYLLESLSSEIVSQYLQRGSSDIMHLQFILNELLAPCCTV